MALNAKMRHLLQHRRKKGDTAKLSDQLAPLEEQEKADRLAVANNGSIIVDTGKLKLPKGFVEDHKGATNPLHVEPVVIVIMLIALAFIAFIAWQISNMPDPVK
ncbi:MAG TPA: hypothetical protein VGB17_11115 [Pyrinomonadaceae bacterium]|jgi:hypothetical protein